MTDHLEFKIEKLSGPKNWPKFKREMMGKYVLDNVDQIVLGKELRPIAPMELETEGPPTKEEKEDYKKELAAW